MEFEVKEFVKIMDGKHEGVIIAIEYRDKPHKYTDIHIEMRGPARIKYGCPTPEFLTTDNKLGKLLKLFGAELTPGKTINPEHTLIGVKCEFQTYTEEKDDKTYATILPNTLKPVPK